MKTPEFAFYKTFCTILNSRKRGFFMTPEIKKQLEIRDQLINGLERENLLQKEIIRKQEDTIAALEKGLAEYRQIVQEILNP